MSGNIVFLAVLFRMFARNRKSGVSTVYRLTKIFSLMDVKNEDAPKDPICLHLIENYPYLVTDDLLLFIVRSGLSEILEFVVDFFDTRTLWRTIFQRPSSEVLSDLFRSLYIQVHIFGLIFNIFFC